MQDILFDPQTSGGLLIGVSDADSKHLLQELKTSGVAHSTIVGNVTDENTGNITVV